MQLVSRLPQQIWVAVMAAVAFAFVMVGAAQAGDKKDPGEFLQEFGNQAIAVLGDTSLAPAARRAALEDLLLRGFAMNRIAKLALGRTWRTATEGQQAKYRDAFQRYIVKTYDRRLQAYSGQTIEVSGWKPTKRDVIVASRIVGNDGSAVDIDWRLTAAGDSWQILDVVVGGVSMLVTQRNEFASIINARNGGVNALIDHLQGAIQMADAG